MSKDARRLSPSTEPSSFNFMPMECNSRESSFVLSVCVPFCLCVSVCLLPKIFNNLCHKFWTLRYRNFICGMDTQLIKPFQMTRGSMTLWPWFIIVTIILSIANMDNVAVARISVSQPHFVHSPLETRRDRHFISGMEAILVKPFTMIYNKRTILYDFHSGLCAKNSFLQNIT